MLLLAVHIMVPVVIPMMPDTYIYLYMQLVGIHVQQLRWQHSQQQLQLICNMFVVPDTLHCKLTATLSYDYDL